MKKAFKLLLLFFLLFHFSIKVNGQGYPVKVQVQLIQPFYPYLSDYTQKSIISFTNTTDVPMDIYIQAKVENDRGQVIKTAPNQYSRIPIHVPGLQTVVVQGFQLDTSFFDLHRLQTNLDDQAKARLYQFGMIPEGFYSYCVTAFIIDGNGNYAAVSDPKGSCAFVNVGYVNPPQIITPLQNDHITPNPLQNVNITWTRPIGNLQGAALTYDLYVVRVLQGQDPSLAMSNAVNYGAGIFMKQENIPATTYRFTNLTNFQLEQGNEYALMVQARDMNGKAAFINNGRSEVSVFTYGDEKGIDNKHDNEPKSTNKPGDIDVVKGRLQWAFKSSEQEIIYKHTSSGELRNIPTPPPLPTSKRPWLEISPVIKTAKPFYKFNTGLLLNTDPSAVFLTENKTPAVEKLKIPAGAKVDVDRGGFNPGRKIGVGDWITLTDAFTASAADSTYSENKPSQTDAASQRFPLQHVNVTLSGMAANAPGKNKLLGTGTTDDDGNFEIQFLDPAYQSSGQFSKLILSVQVHDFENTVFEIPVSGGNISGSLNIGTKVLLARTWRFFPEVKYEETDATDAKAGVLHIYREVADMKDRPWLMKEGRITDKKREQKIVDGKEVIEIASIDVHQKSGFEMMTDMALRRSSGEGVGRLFYGGKLLVKIEPTSPSYYKVSSTVTAFNKSLPGNEVMEGDAVYQLKTTPSHIEGKVSLFLPGQSSLPVSGAVVRIMYRKTDVVEKAPTIFGEIDDITVSRVSQIDILSGTELTNNSISKVNLAITGHTPAVIINSAPNNKSKSPAYSINQVVKGGEEAPSPVCDGCSYVIAHTDATGAYFSRNLPVLRKEASFTVEVITVPVEFRKFQIKNKSGKGYPATVLLGKGVSKTQDFTMDAEVVDVGGRVVDRDGNPLTGVRLVFKGNTLTTSGEDGLFIFKLYPGNHTITLEKEGYIQKDVVINIPITETKGKQQANYGTKWFNMTVSEKNQATLDRIKNIPSVQSAISAGHKFSPALFGLPETNSTQSAIGITSYNASIIAAFGIFNGDAQHTEYEVPRESAFDAKDIGYLEKISGKIQFTIKDKTTGAPVADAQINVFDTAHLTDSNGQWYYEGFGGATTITVKPSTASGYAPEQKLFTLPENGKVQQVTILLEKGITISGVVKSGSTNLANAEVFADDGALSSTRTDNTGRYSLVLKKGKHDLGARLQNYVGQTNYDKSVPEDGNVFNFDLEGGNGKNYGILMGFDIELSKVEKSGSQEIWSGNFIHVKPTDASVFVLDKSYKIPFSNVKVSFDASGNAKPVNGKVETDVVNIPLKIYGFLPASFSNGSVVTIADAGGNKGQLKGKVAIDFGAVQGYRGWKIPGDLTVMITRKGVPASNFEFAAANTGLAPPTGAWTLVTATGNPFDAMLYGFKIHLNNNATISESGLEFSGSIATPTLPVIKSVEIRIKNFSINRSLAISGVQVETGNLPKLSIAEWEASFSSLIFNEDGFKIGGKLAFTIPSSGKSEIDFSELAIAKDEIFGGKFTVPKSGINLLSVANINTGGVPLTFGRVGGSDVYRIGGKANLKINLNLFSKEFKIPTFEVLTNGAFNLQAPVGYSTTVGPFGFSINNLYINTTDATPFIGIQGGFKTDLDFIKFEVADIKVKAGAGGPTYSIEKVGITLDIPIVKIGASVAFKDNGFEGSGSLSIPATPIKGDVKFHYFKTGASLDLGADFFTNLPPVPIGVLVTLEGIGGGFNYNNGDFSVDVNGKLSFLGTGAVVALDKLGLTVSSRGILKGYGDVTVGTYLKTAHAEAVFNGPESSFTVQVAAQMSPLEGLVKQEVKGALVISAKPHDEFAFLGCSVDVKIAELVDNHGEMAVAIGLKNPKYHDALTAHYFAYAPDEYMGDVFSGVYINVAAQLGIPPDRPLGFDITVASAKLWCSSAFQACLILNFAENAYRIKFGGKFDGGFEGCVAKIACVNLQAALCYVVEGGRNDAQGWNFSATATGQISCGFGIGIGDCSPGCNEVETFWDGCVGGAFKVCAGAYLNFSFSQNEGLKFNVHGGDSVAPCF